MTAKSILALAAFAGLTGCALPNAPQPSAFSRNIGFSSTVYGPVSSMGNPNSGNDEVLGAPTAGGTGGNSQ